MLNQAKIRAKDKLFVLLLLASVLLASSPRVSKAQELGKENEAAEVRSLPLAGPREPRRAINAVLTAYSSTPDQTDDTPFIAASGVRVYDGLIAVNWLRFGTRVKFPELFGDKVFIVDDRMHPRYGRYGRVDVWMNAPREELMAFGVKRTKMLIF